MARPLKGQRAGARDLRGAATLQIRRLWARARSYGCSAEQGSRGSCCAATAARALCQGRRVGGLDLVLWLVVSLRGPDGPGRLRRCYGCSRVLVEGRGWGYYAESMAIPTPLLGASAVLPWVSEVLSEQALGAYKLLSWLFEGFGPRFSVTTRQ